jgi:hypothetical protein
MYRSLIGWPRDIEARERGPLRKSTVLWDVARSPWPANHLCAVAAEAMKNDESNGSGFCRLKNVLQ